MLLCTSHRGGLVDHFGLADVHASLPHVQDNAAESVRSVLDVLTDGSFTYDRIGRGTLHIPALAPSVFSGIQPGKLRSYIDGAIAGKSDADGLLQRFQLLVWPDGPGKWKNVDRWPDKAARDRAFQIFESLDALEAQRGLLQ